MHGGWRQRELAEMTARRKLTRWCTSSLDASPPFEDEAEGVAGLTLTGQDGPCGRVYGLERLQQRSDLFERKRTKELAPCERGDILEALIGAVEGRRERRVAGLGHHDACPRGERT
jgi:hypothetical protein